MKVRVKSREFVKIAGLALVLWVSPLCAKESKRKPIVAGIGPGSPPHSCQMDYSACRMKCSALGGPECFAECDSDCEVCSLDFGEEKRAVCLR